MKLIKFENNTAQIIYDNYMQRCKKTVRILSEKDKEDCLLEINSYIYEFLNANKTIDEIQNLSEILNRLGKPEDVLKEVVASKKMAQAIKTFNPKYLIQALVLNVKKGVTYTILSSLILILLCLPVLFLFKFIYPKNIGCFIGENSFFFGFTSFTNNTTEVLGYWFFPTTLLMIIIVYFSVIFLLKSVKKAPLNYYLMKVTS